MYIICVWGALKGPKSNFEPVHFAPYFGNFTLLVLKLILASELSELEQFEYFAANYQQQKAEKSENDTKIKLMPLPSNRNLFVGKVMMSRQ